MVLCSAKTLNEAMQTWEYYMHAGDRPVFPCRAEFWSKEGKAHCRLLLDMLASSLGYRSLSDAEEGMFPPAENEYALTWKMSGFELVCEGAEYADHLLIAQMVDCCIEESDDWQKTLNVMQSEVFNAIKTYGNGDAV